ncbi:MAG: TonB-dependent receptor [Gemmatimonadota bacterium]
MRTGMIMPSGPSGRRWAWIAAAVLATSAPAAAAPAVDTLSLRGVVVDSVSGQPLPAAVVRLLELDRRDVTGDDGGFHLRRLRPGDYTLLVEHVGYRATARPVTVPRGTPAVLRVEMAASVLDLPGLLVTATLGARTRSEAHSLSQVLGGRELQRSLAVTLAETLEGEAGLAAASMGPAPARPVIRGLSGDRILVLEDGERVGDVSATSPDHAVAVEVGSAERIEVVRGPAAVFYGSNALGGVINVVREEIPVALPGAPTGLVTLQARSASRGGLAAATYRRAAGPVGIRLEASGRTAGDTRTPVGVLPNTGLATYSGAAGASWLGGPGHAGVAGRLYRSEYGIPPDSVLGHPAGVTVEVERDVVRGEAVLTGPIPGTLEATAAFTRYDHREIEASGSVGTAFGKNSGTTEAVLRHDRLGPFASGGFGVRGGWEAFASDNGRSIVRSTALSGAVYGLEEIELGATLIQLGARYDVQRSSPEDVGEVRGVPARARVFRSVSGSASALWELAPGWRLGASASRAFRAPSADELFAQGPHLAAYTFEVGNPDLESETGVGADLFLRVDRPGLGLEAGVFWNEIEDYIYPANTGERRGDLFVYRAVNTDARFFGAEASGRWVVTGSVVLDGDVSWVRADNLAVGEPLPLIPPLQGRLRLRWDRDAYFLEAGWQGAARQDRVPERPALPPHVPRYCDEVPDGEPCRPVPGDFLPTGGYGTVNAAIGYRWFPGHQVHSVTLTLENLTDELYRNHLSRIKELSPEAGRGVTISYRASF